MSRSITVDKQSLKTEEHDLYTSETTQIVASKVCGFLGILQIYGLDHFVVATERDKVCELPTYKQPGTNATTAVVYGLKQVQLIPFFEIHGKNESKLIQEESKSASAQQEQRFDAEKISEVVVKIKKYLEEGFLFSYNYDLTSNLQRQRRLYEEFGWNAKEQVQQNYAWNLNMFQKIKAQNISQFWCTHLVQGFIDKQRIQDKMDVVLIARRGAERGGTRFLHRGIDENGFVANFVEFEQIVTRVEQSGSLDIYSYAQVRGTFPFFWTQPNVSKFVIEKEMGAAKPFFEQHMRMLFERYCDEVPQGEPAKIFSMNLVRDNEGNKERTLAAYYEQLLDSVKDELAAEGKSIGYSNYNWHARTKQDTSSFSALLNSLDEDYLRKFGIYHETRSQFSKEGVVKSQ